MLLQLLMLEVLLRRCRDLIGRLPSAWVGPLVNPRRRLTNDLLLLRRELLERHGQRGGRASTPHDWRKGWRDAGRHLSAMVGQLVNPRGGRWLTNALSLRS